MSAAPIPLGPLLALGDQVRVLPPHPGANAAPPFIVEPRYVGRVGRVVGISYGDGHRTGEMEGWGDVGETSVDPYYLVELSEDLERNGFFADELERLAPPSPTR
jgi:hypothetical protein